MNDSNSPNLTFLQYEVLGDDLYIFLNRRIDAVNISDVENELHALISSFPGKNYILVASNLKYVSSAGFRMLIKLAKLHPNIKIIDINEDIYRLLLDTGLNRVMSLDPYSVPPVNPKNLNSANDSKNKINEEKVSYRNLKDDDLYSLLDIASTTIGDHRNQPAGSARLSLITVDFANSLQRADYAMVAEYEEKPVAILLGRCTLPIPKDYDALPKLYQVKDRLNLLLSKEGRKLYKGYKAFEEFDRELLSASGKDFDGEVVYFNQSPQFYDTQVGYELLEKFRKYLLARGARNFYFLIHSDKKHDFFIAKGFKFIASKDVALEGSQPTKISLYEYDTSKPVL